MIKACGLSPITFLVELVRQGNRSTAADGADWRSSPVREEGLV
jgi:hypothetical protein